MAVILTLMAAIAVRMRYSRYELEAFFFNKIIHWNPYGRSEYFRWEQLFEAHIAYFRPLSLAGRARFVGRAVRFVRNADMRAMQDMELTTEAQMLLAASAVQLTFGLSEYHISHLKVVRVYPEPFYHRQTGQWFKGAVTEAGNLSISWADFLNGYADNNDNYNLGLHEMAHVLKLDAKYHRNDHFSHYINLWLQAAKPKVLMLLEGRASFLRDYAAENPQEFFAVCVEHFFESPAAFLEQLPHLYLHTCILLSQNPLNTEGDYQLTREFIRSVR